MTFNTHLQENYSVLYERTQRRAQTILALMPGFSMVEMWGHDWAEIKKNSDVASFLKKEEVHEPLVPRHSLFGGR
jgi:hypothetical protein